MSGAPAVDELVGYRVGDRVLGKYRLIAAMAHGGMGAVWRGKNEVLGTDVAVKVACPQPGASDEPADIVVRRAEREAQLAAQLRHPAVCRTLDFGVTPEGHAVVVSELLRGETLEQLLARAGPLESTRAVRLLLPIVDALSCAHARGIVHRDVKPSNIFLSDEGHGTTQPKLLDFGIARALHQSTRLTAAGTVCGTADYMSPEQARGSRTVDARSDLWSLCVTLFESVTGRVPFVGENYNAVMFEIIQGAPVDLGILSPADADLSRLLERGLRKNRDERFQSGAELAKALRQLLREREKGRPVPASRTGGARTLRWPWGPLALLGVTALLVLSAVGATTLDLAPDSQLAAPAPPVVAADPAAEPTNPSADSRSVLAGTPASPVVDPTASAPVSSPTRSPESATLATVPPGARPAARPLRAPAAQRGAAHNDTARSGAEEAARTLGTTHADDAEVRPTAPVVPRSPSPAKTGNALGYDFAF